MSPVLPGRKGATRVQREPAALRGSLRPLFAKSDCVEVGATLASIGRALGPKCCAGATENTVAP